MGRREGVAPIGGYQRIGNAPGRRAERKSFASLKWRQPRNGVGPLTADKGEGWFAVKTRCDDEPSRSTNARFRWADAPHNMTTAGCGCAATRTSKASVNASHPRLA